MVTRTNEIPAWHQLAGQCLRSAVAGDEKLVAALIAELGNEHPNAWPEVLYTMIDSMALVQGITPEQYGMGLRQHAKVAGVPDSDDVKDAIAWSNAMITARMTNDRASYYSLCNQPRTRKQAGLYVANLIMSLGITIRGIMDGTLTHKGECNDGH
jgi:hypothetical protein